MNNLDEKMIQNQKDNYFRWKAKKDIGWRYYFMCRGRRELLVKDLIEEYKSKHKNYSSWEEKE